MNILETYRKVVNKYHQAKDLETLTVLLEIKKPLSKMRDWAISPDFGLLLAHKILELKPGTVLELGSGVSTIITGYCLKHIGKGKIISWEHNEKFAEETRRMVKEHGLEEYAQVEYRPLKNVELDGKIWEWYDTEKSIPPSINFLTVDGPPSPKGTMARFPAFPILKNYLAKDAVIILDDGKRDLRIAELWGKPFVTFPLEKGAIVLTK